MDALPREHGENAWVDSGGNYAASLRVPAPVGHLLALLLVGLVHHVVNFNECEELDRNHVEELFAGAPEYHRRPVEHFCPGQGFVVYAASAALASPGSVPIAF